MAGRVGIVGIGIMGTAMMRNLSRHCFEVVGYNIARRRRAGTRSSRRRARSYSTARSAAPAPRRSIKRVNSASHAWSGQLR